MAVSLAKGGISLISTKAPGLKNIIIIELGWDVRDTASFDVDVDACAFLVKENGKVRDDNDFIFYNNPKSPDGSVVFVGNIRINEQIKVNLDGIPNDITKIVLSVTIHDAENLRQNFGMVQSAFIRIVNAADNEEIVRYDLSEDFSIETAMIFGEVYRHSGGWKFRAVGQGFAGGLAALAKNFGVNI